MVPLYVLGLVAVVAVDVIIVSAVASQFQPPPKPYVEFSAQWGISGCAPNATNSVPLDYSGRFTNINGPDAYAVVGIYVNQLLRNVSTYFVPKGTWDMTISGSLPVSCSTYHNADVAVISTVLA